MTDQPESLEAENAKLRECLDKLSEENSKMLAREHRTHSISAKDLWIERLEQGLREAQTTLNKYADVSAYDHAHTARVGWANQDCGAEAKAAAVRIDEVLRG